MATLVGFGILALFSYGLPFLLLGLVLGALYPVRDRPRAFWPVVAGVVGVVAGYLLVAPLGCTATPVGQATGHPGRAECGSLVGIEYSGPVPYQPPVLPALGTAVATGLAAAGAIRRVQSRRSGPRHPEAPEAQS